MHGRRSIIVAGLGFGDEGKGSIVDFLCAATGSKLVCRYNGGPQAAHHVVNPDGGWHCFSQFGAGSFNEDTRTHLSGRMLLKPSNLLVERDALIAKGLARADTLITIDPDAFIVTPYHGLLNRMEETARGSRRLGSVGMGVGKAALDREQNPDALRLRDLFSPLLKEKIKDHVGKYERQLKLLVEAHNSEPLEKMYASRITYEALTAFYIQFAEYASSSVKSDEAALGSSNTDTPIIFEGAQGILLDKRYGLTPHVTKTDVTFNSASSLPLNSQTSTVPLKLGILRAYSTRHGAGPFVAEDQRITALLPEYHNGTNEWQGAFRAGLFDLVMARYALAVSGGTDAIALTCLDRLTAIGEVKIVTNWQYRGSTADIRDLFDFEVVHEKILISGIKVQAIENQDLLAKAMQNCSPGAVLSFGALADCGAVKTFDELPISARKLISFLESTEGLGVPIPIISLGPTRQSKIENPAHVHLFNYY